MFVFDLALGYVVFVCGEYDICEYCVGSVSVFWCFNVLECILYFLCVGGPVCFVVVSVDPKRLL